MTQKSANLLFTYMLLHMFHTLMLGFGTGLYLIAVYYATNLDLLAKIASFTLGVFAAIGWLWMTHLVGNFLLQDKE